MNIEGNKLVTIIEVKEFILCKYVGNNLKHGIDAIIK